MTRAERLTVLLREDVPRLDRLMAVVGSIADDSPDEDGVTAAFDALADACGDIGTPAALLSEVFGRLGFRGNAVDYYDVRNSLIHHVLRRRTGIPLSLAVVAVEVGRRLGVDMAAIGLPGHVLLGTADGGGFFDPFAGGRRLDRSDIEGLFASLHPAEGLRDEHLSPMSATAIVTRTLENLRGALLRSGDLAQLVSVLELRAVLPAAPIEFMLDYARVLANVGRFDMAADVRDALALLEPPRADHHTMAAQRLRAHRN